MRDLMMMAASVHTALQEMARQTAALATGLQNAAPGDKATPNKSVQYLFDISDELTILSQECEVLLSTLSSLSSQNTPRL